MKIWAFRFCRASRGKPFLVIVFVAAWCLIAGLSAAETIQGTIRYVGAPIEKKKTAVTIDQYICGKEKEPEELLLSSNNGIRNAVVSLQNVPPGGEARLEFTGREDGSETMLVHSARGHRAGGRNGRVSQ